MSPASKSQPFADSKYTNIRTKASRLQIRHTQTVVQKTPPSLGRRAHTPEPSSHTSLALGFLESAPPLSAAWPCQNLPPATIAYGLRLRLWKGQCSQFAPLKTLVDGIRTHTSTSFHRSFASRTYSLFWLGKSHSRYVLITICQRGASSFLTCCTSCTIDKEGEARTKSISLQDHHVHTRAEVGYVNLKG